MTRFVVASARWSWLPGLLMLLGCGSSPPQTVYVLGAAADPVPGVTSVSGRPVVELKPVTVPDYMDTTDILLRDGQNALKSSQTGRWGERLSVGIARALREDLTTRMPAIEMAQGDPVQPPTRTLLVDIAGFDVRPDGRCVLAAHWTVLGEDSKTVLASERATIIANITQSTGGMADPAIVSAMAGAVGQLADHIAMNVSRSLRNTGAGVPSNH